MKNSLLSENITPYVGLETFKLGMKLEEVRTILKANKIPFNQKIQSNKDTTEKVPWIFISIEESVTFCFAKDVMYEIYLENSYKGVLPNGGYIGMEFRELQEIDPSLVYNDDEEDFESKEGYWVLDNLDTKKVESITIFLPEVPSQAFYTYQWVEKYI